METLMDQEARDTAPKALAHLDTSITQSRSFHWPERGPFKNLESKLKRLKRNGNFPLLRALNFADLDPLSTYIYLLLASCNKNHQPHNKKHLFNKPNIVPYPFPPNRAHPTFEGPSRDEHHYHHHQNRPPVYHQPPRPVLHSHHDHVLNRRRDSHFDAVLEGFMESQRKTSRDIETKLEFTRYELDGRLGELSTQIERVESRCLDMEEDLKKQGEAIEDSRRAIHFTKVSTKEMDNHLDEKITSLDNNLDGTTKSLNSITAVAHQAKREVAEVTLKERQCYSTMLTLVEGQKQVKAQIRDLHISLDKRAKIFKEELEGLKTK
ncbi:unnamed protein product [Microthlaspi erraticum]|uniref:Uncharacterized protein n=1 Tax=Microthlaspi erraticum TaxID=1685480 RepID=A0A6D2J4T3_9BRAS|nr:unnamed protein product [Microthlaspi erraticum]